MSTAVAGKSPISQRYWQAQWNMHPGGGSGIFDAGFALKLLEALDL